MIGGFSCWAGKFTLFCFAVGKTSFELFPDKLTVQVNYNTDTIENGDENKVNRALIYNSIAAFALIDNLEAMNYNFTNATYKVLRSDVKKL